MKNTKINTIKNELSKNQELILNSVPKMKGFIESKIYNPTQIINDISQEIRDNFDNVCSNYELDESDKAELKDLNIEHIQQFEDKLSS